MISLEKECFRGVVKDLETMSFSVGLGSTSNN